VTSNTTRSDPRIKVLLLAAGTGTRLRPLTESVPKCLIPVAGRPLLEYWLDRFEQAGLKQILINTHHLAGQVESYVQAVNRRQRAEIHTAFESGLLGSAGTVAANRAWADDADHVLIVYSDNLSNVDLGEMISRHRQMQAPFTMMLFRSPRPETCGIARLDDHGRIVEFQEKPPHPKSDLANGGVYVVTSDVYREIADMRVFDLGYDVLPRFVGRMYGWHWHGYHRDIGSLDSLEQAERDARDVFPESGSTRNEAGSFSTFAT
jgi:mannose-1-phosphate guanylyltransferase